jgi:hypothetical protein
MKEGGAGYFAQASALAPLMEKLRSVNRHYLSHEYLNGHWYPLYHLDVVREMENARLTYACSATITENMDAASVAAALQPILAETNDRGWQETLRDFASNKQFRRDLFMRGVVPISAFEQSQLLATMRFALVVPRSAATLKFTVPLGEVTGNEELYLPLLDALARKPLTLKELAKSPGVEQQPVAALRQAIAMLVHSRQVLPLPHDALAKTAEVARAFNKAVTRRIRFGEHLNFLAAPAAGTGISASYVEMIAALALLENPGATVQSAAEMAWPIMAQTGQRLLKDGKTFQTQEETMPELEVQLATFWNEKLPIWQTLGVV